MLDATFDTIAMQTPYVFLIVYGTIAMILPRFRWVGLIVASSAFLNLVLKLDGESNYVAVLGLFSVIDFATAWLMLRSRNITIFGQYFGTEGAEMQAFVLTLFIAFNSITLLDFLYFGYALYYTYIPVIFILNIIQILMVGRDIYGDRIKRDDAGHLGVGVDIGGLSTGHSRSHRGNHANTLYDEEESR